MNQKNNLPFNNPFIKFFTMLCFSAIIIFSPRISGAHKGENRAYIYHGSSFSASRFQEHILRYDTLALTGFRLTSRGDLRSAPGAGMKNRLTALQRGERPWHPVITFSSSRAGQGLLKNPALRTKAVKNIGALAKKHDLKVIHLDFEYLKPAYTRFLAVFLSEIKKTIPGLKISMALFPQVDFPAKWSRFHDPKLLSSLIDEAVIMCYDYHRPGTKPGPVTTLSWAEKNICHYLRYFPPEKLLLGIPGYGYLWSDRGDHITLSARFVSACRTCIKSRHLQSGTLSVEITRKGKRYRGFVADRTAREKLCALARRYRLRGTALWRLGFEELK